MVVEKYLLLDPSGNVSWIDLDRELNYGPVFEGAPALSFDQIYAAIGCDCVEQVRTVLHGLVLVVDESGKIKDPPQQHNELASKLYAGYHAGYDDICGPAIVMALKHSGPYGEVDWNPLDTADLARLSFFLGVKLPD